MPIARLAGVRPLRRSPYGPGRTLLIACLLLTAASCTGLRPELGAETEPPTDQVTPVTVSAGAATYEVAEAPASEIDVYADATSTEPTRTITVAEAVATPDVPITFVVRARSGDRLEVYLPVSPPGATGWINAGDVTVSAADYRLEISLGGHWLRLRQRGQVILDAPVAVGTGGDAPALGDAYYLKELLEPPDPTGPYGTYAYGLSGFATSLTSFTSGEGLVGIHGTDDESSIGEDVTDGSIAVSDEVLDRLVNDIGLPLGTPVQILP